jgi:hypothetical protein
MKAQLFTPIFKPPTRLDDSGAIVCLPNVWTQLLALTTAKSKWIQVRISQDAANGNILIGTGAAGLEVQLLHWSFDAGTNWDVGNLLFEIPAGVRISARPSVQVTVEFHLYY